MLLCLAPQMREQILKDSSEVPGLLPMLSVFVYLCSDSPLLNGEVAVRVPTQNVVGDGVALTIRCLKTQTSTCNGVKFCVCSCLASVCA